MSCQNRIQIRSQINIQMKTTTRRRRTLEVGENIQLKPNKATQALTYTTHANEMVICRTNEQTNKQRDSDRKRDMKASKKERKKKSDTKRAHKHTQTNKLVSTYTHTHLLKNNAITRKQDLETRTHTCAR